MKQTIISIKSPIYRARSFIDREGVWQMGYVLVLVSAKTKRLGRGKVTSFTFGHVAARPRNTTILTLMNSELPDYTYGISELWVSAVDCNYNSN